MQRHQTMNKIKHLFLALAFLFASILPGHTAELTQRDWMVTLVDTLGWSYGLPDEPQDTDYINILSGSREFLFEAEDVYAKDEDNVSVMSFINFGDFSGSGWLNSSREPTQVHLQVSLPIGGKYEIDAHIRKPGHRFSVAGALSTHDGEEAFTLVPIGLFELQPGAQEIVVTLPPGGSIDYITFRAPNLAAISPGEGWQPDKPLTWVDIQTTLLQLLNLAELLPRQTTPLVLEAEELNQTEVKVVTIPHLGHPSGGKWLRNGPLPAEVRFPVNLAESGFYDLTLRLMGHPITISVDDHQEFKLEAKSYLDNYTFNALFLFAGNSHITLSLPPGGGVDQLILNERQIDAALVNTLLGFKHQDEPGARDLDTITSLLAAFGVTR